MMVYQNQVCPVCGSSHVRIEEEERLIFEPYGGQKAIRLQVCVCMDCGADGDFLNQNDTSILAAQNYLKANAVSQIVNYLNDTGYSSAAMERAFGLPARTIAKWKRESDSCPSASAVALLRIVRTFPWLISVADAKFDHAIAQRIFITEAIKDLLKYRLTNSEQVSSGVITNSEETLIYLDYLQDHQESKLGGNGSAQEIECSTWGNGRGML
jgi:DNA-binding transcriptional regulator YiaG